MVVNCRPIRQVRKSLSAFERTLQKIIHKKYRVFADGVEVKQVYYYDGRRRIVRANKLNAEGMAYVENGEVAVYQLRPRRVRLISVDLSMREMVQ